MPKGGLGPNSCLFFSLQRDIKMESVKSHLESVCPGPYSSPGQEMGTIKKYKDSEVGEYGNSFAGPA
jgi:hypothetical protein